MAADSFALVCVRFSPGKGEREGEREGKEGQEGEGNCSMVNQTYIAALSARHLYTSISTSITTFTFSTLVPSILPSLSLTLPPFSFSYFFYAYYINLTTQFRGELKCIINGEDGDTVLLEGAYVPTSRNSNLLLQTISFFRFSHFHID